MPNEIEEVFQQAGVALFPTRSGDLVTSCSCPDWSNPCKHIAAVYYLLGEEFDRDPFLIFALRGMQRESLLDRLRAAAETHPMEEPTAELAVPTLPPEPLALDPVAFWSGDPLLDALPLTAQPPAVTAPLLRRLGDFPFWRGEQVLLTALTPVYAEATPRSLELCLHLAPQERGVNHDRDQGE